MRTTFLIVGLAPFLVTHPFTLHTILPLLLEATAKRLVRLRVMLMRLVDNDRLEDKHWCSELKVVELWENERWVTPSGSEDNNSIHAGWSKSNLRPGERKPWTRGRDGWSGVSDDGSGDVRSVRFRVCYAAAAHQHVGPSPLAFSSNLTFSLSPGWLFVETEEWRPDLEGSWIGQEYADERECLVRLAAVHTQLTIIHWTDGWVYTDDVWMHPGPAPLEAWKASNGMTRRRRWVRRIYYDPAAAM